MELNKIINADCLDYMRTMPDKSVDLVLTDPPYFKIVKNEWDNQWADIFEFQAWCGKIADELKRIMKDNASLYWFGDDKTIAYVQTELDKRFNLLNSIVWRKNGLQTFKGVTVFRSFAPITERILFYDKGEDKSGLTMLFSNPDLFSSKPGDVVFDPFSGSGTTAVAAHKLGRKFIGTEKDAGYWEKSCARLEQEQQQLLLF